MGDSRVSGLSALNGNPWSKRLQGVLDGGADGLGRHVRLPAADDRSVAADKPLGEVPAHLAAAFGLAFQPCEHRVLVGGVDIDNAENREGDAMGLLVRLLLFDGSALAHKLVGVEAEDRETLIVVIAMESGQLAELGCESSQRRSVDDQHYTSFVSAKRNIFPGFPIGTRQCKQAA